MAKKAFEKVDSIESLEAKLAEMREAAKAYSTFTQEQVDAITLAAAKAADKARIPLAKMANAETGIGVVEDKVIKNNYAAEHIHNAYRYVKTCGVIEENKAAGTGSEVPPFTIISDAETGYKWPLADYEILPTMAIVDADYMMNMPPSVTRASGYDVLTHAVEAYVSVFANDYTDGPALMAIRSVFKYLPRAYKNGAADPEARIKMADASCLAGIAFANAMLGVNHSLAHKLGGYHHLPHGAANAVLFTEVCKYNAQRVPTKMGTFSQYK